MTRHKKKRMKPNVLRLEDYTNIECLGQWDHTVNSSYFDCGYDALFSCEECLVNNGPYDPRTGIKLGEETIWKLIKLKTCTSTTCFSVLKTTNKYFENCSRCDHPNEKTACACENCGKEFDERENEEWYEAKEAYTREANAWLDVSDTDSRRRAMDVDLHRDIEKNS